MLFVFMLPITLLAQSHVGKWKADLPDGNGGTVSITVEMKADNSYAVDIMNDGSIDITGKYSVDGSKMTIQDDAGSDCTGKGVYTLEISGNSLKMTRVSDACQGRGGPSGVMTMTKV